MGKRGPILITPCVTVLAACTIFFSTWLAATQEWSKTRWRMCKSSSCIKRQCMHVMPSMTKSALSMPINKCCSILYCTQVLEIKLWPGSCLHQLELQCQKPSDIFKQNQMLKLVIDTSLSDIKLQKNLLLLKLVIEAIKASFRYYARLPSLSTNNILYFIKTT